MNRSTNKDSIPYACYEKPITIKNSRAFNEFCKRNKILSYIRIGNSYLVSHPNGINYICTISD